MIDTIVSSRLRVVFFLSTDNISIPPQYSTVHYVIETPTRVFDFAKCLATHDIAFLHLRQGRVGLFWICLCLLAGLRSYVPPIVVNGYKKSEDLVSFYKTKLSEAS